MWAGRNIIKTRYASNIRNIRYFHNYFLAKSSLSSRNLAETRKNNFSTYEERKREELKLKVGIYIS